MDRILLFNLLLVLASGYALGRGGAPERVAGLALLTAGFATRLLLGTGGARQFINVEIGVMAVDVTLLAVLVALALYADRFWTLWVAALQALGTGAHIVRAMDGEVLRVAYAILMASWSYPIVILLVIATMRHSRRVRSEGGDLDWSARGRT